MPDNAGGGELGAQGGDPGYGEAYLDWKEWDTADFGALLPQERAYFDAEMRRTGLALDKNLDVFEVGFGEGHFLTYAKNKGWNVGGSEVIEPLVKVAQSKGFQAVLGTDLSGIADSSYDLVAAFNVLEHIDQDMIERFLAEMRRILKDGGVLLAVFPNGDSAIGLIYQNGDVTHKTFIGSGKAEYFAKKAGAEVVYLGAEAMPLLAGTVFHTMHRVISIPIRSLFNLLFRVIFFPRQNISYFSVNLTMILRMRKRPRLRTG